MATVAPRWLFPIPDASRLEVTPVVVSGVITLLLGLIILAHWPVSSLWTLGIFLGVDLVFAGASWIGIGIGLRQGSPV